MVQGVLGTRSRRGLAILAAAVVLAGGTITSLAAWNETEQFQQQVGTSRLHLEARIGGSAGTWTSVDATPGGLSFTVPTLSTALLSPDVTASSFVELRAAANSQGASVNLSTSSILSSSGSSALSSLLSFSATGSGSGSTVSQSDCIGGTALSPTALSGVSLAGWTALGATPTGGSGITVPDPTTAGSPGDPVGLCLRVKMGTPAAGTLTSVLSGASVTPLWTFVATSAR